jgi:hypothetical protein
MKKWRKKNQNQRAEKNPNIITNFARQQKDKRTNNDLQNTTQKDKDRVTRSPLKIEVEPVVAIDLNSPLYFNLLSK